MVAVAVFMVDGPSVRVVVGGQAAANSALAPVMSMRISSREREVSVISVTWMRWSNASWDTAAVVAPWTREAVAVDVDGDAVAGQQAGERGRRAGCAR